MKLPRNVSGEEFARVLRQLGYRRINQTGSHYKMRHEGPPGHSVTVPLHKVLKTGTLHGMISDVVRARSISAEEVIALL